VDRRKFMKSAAAAVASAAVPLPALGNSTEVRDPLIVTLSTPITSGEIAAYGYLKEYETNILKKFVVKEHFLRYKQKRTTE